MHCHIFIQRQEFNEYKLLANIVIQQEALRSIDIFGNARIMRFKFNQWLPKALHQMSHNSQDTNKKGPIKANEKLIY